MQRMANSRAVVTAALGLALALGAVSVPPRAWSGPGDADSSGANGEFHFIRLEYVNLAWTRRGWGRPWWMQDWPAADTHFTQGIRRLTLIDAGDGRHVPLTDDRIFDYPWVYATQVGYWDLSERETGRLREYLLRGGFLMVDDFYGPQDWEVFRASMQRVFPEWPIVEIGEDDAVLHVLYDVGERIQIPGLRHLWRGADGGVSVRPNDTPPHWRGIYDGEGRLLVAVNFNMDIGDAWEHADLPEYPEPMTALAYRFGINYILYAMTH
jgi:Domain of unknown function (DUF4159)